MKKFLSLVLALVMTMSLVTVSAGAKEFKDDKDVTYDEAVAVISEIGVVDGDTDGNFRPTDNLSRGAAAKIICNLILGPTTAAELKADTAPYKDVPVSNVFSGYIAYCAKEGIISGYADGSFRPAGTLTGYAFMKMLLGALGYDGTYEGYTGANWSINVAKQAIGIGLNKGLTKEFNGVDFVTREEAALYAFNTLKSTLVSYDQKITTNVNGVDVTITQGAAKPVDWAEGINKDGNIKPDGFVQFAEEYFPKLVGRVDSDDFERPATQWVFDKKEIGTYVRWEKMVEKYTAGVTGREVYDLLTGAIIDANKVLRYVDGGQVKDFDEDKELVRANKNNLDYTGNGVLTEVYLDTDEDEIRIVSINTWLAQAVNDYNKTSETATVKVFEDHVDTPTQMATKPVSKTVDLADVPAVADLKKDQYILVNQSVKDNDGELEIVEIADVEILEDCTVTGFSKNTEDKHNFDSEAAQGLYKSVTTGGETYNGAKQNHYDASVLNEYDAGLLKDNKYNVYLDPYDYVIGVDLYEGTKNYVFIAGYNLDENSNISIETAKAAAIFMDGTMKPITVNVKDTNKNIAATFNKNGYTPYFANTDVNEGDNIWKGPGEANENKWYTYTENDGVYTLKPVKQQSATEMADVPGAVTAGSVTTGTIDCSKVYLPDSRRDDGSYAHGEEASVYIVVSQGEVDTADAEAITDVDGVYTGVQDVKIELNSTKLIGEENDNHVGNKTWHVDPVYTVYDGNGYVIASIVIGEAQGSNKNYAYILSGAQSETRKDGKTYWTFECIIDGEKKTLTIEDKYTNTISALVPYSVQELVFNGDYVVKVNSPAADVTCAMDQLDPVNDKIYDITFDNVHHGQGTANENAVTERPKAVDAGTLNVDNTTIWSQGLTLKTSKMMMPGTPPTDLTLHTQGAGGHDDKAQPVGLAVKPDAPIYVIQMENNKETIEKCSGLDEAVLKLADADTSVADTQFRGRIVAALDGGRAEWVVIISATPNGVKAPSGGQKGNVATLRGDVTVGGNTLKGSFASAELMDLQSNGTAVFQLEYTAPQWVPSNAIVTLTAPVYYNNMQMVGYNFMTTAMLTNGKVGIMGQVTGLPAGLDRSKLTLGKLTVETFSAVNVYYVDQAGKDLSTTLAAKTSTLTTVTAPGADVKVGLTNTSTGAVTITQTGAMKVGDGAITISANWSDLNTVGGYAINGSDKWYATSAAPVVVTIDTSNRVDTYELKSTLAGDKAAAVSVVSTGGTAKAINLINTDPQYASVDDTLVIKSDKAAANGLADNELITFTATLAQGGAGFEANSYKVTLTTDKGVLNFVVKPGALTDTDTIRVAGGDITITDVKVEIDVPLVDVLSVKKLNEFTIEVKFNQGVEKTGPAAVTETEVDVQHSGGDFTASKFTATKGGDTVTIELPSALQDGDKVIFGTGVLSSFYTTNALTGQTWVYSSATGEFAKP